MGEPNNALAVYMNRRDRIRDLLECYLAEELPEDWNCEETRGFYIIRNSKGKLSFRQRDFTGKVSLWGTRFRLGLENQDSVNLTYPWRMMELDCPGIVVDNSWLREIGGGNPGAEPEQ